MSWFKILFTFFGVCFAFVLRANEDKSLWVEKKKTLSYSYDLAPSDKISIDNQFGDVKMKIWNSERIRVEIVITANAPSDLKAEEFLKLAYVEATKSLGLVSFKTNLNTHSSTYKNNINWSDKVGDKNQLRVDYLVYLPNNHELTLENSFGDIYLPELISVVNLNQNYGTLFAEKITNQNSKININFGKAFIKSMNGGDLKANYSDLMLDEAIKTKLENKFGKIRVKSLVDVDGVISYSTGLLENIKEAANFQIDFSNGLKMGNIGKDVKHIQLDCNYSSVELPMESIENVDFEVKTTNGNVKFPDNREIRFSKNSDKEQQPSDFKYYFGTCGDGNQNATKVIIKSNYGNVKIK